MTEEPIYELLKPKECLILLKREDKFLVATNIGGNIRLTYLKIEGD